MNEELKKSLLSLLSFLTLLLLITVRSHLSRPRTFALPPNQIIARVSAQIPAAVVGSLAAIRLVGIATQGSLLFWGLNLLRLRLISTPLIFMSR